MSKEKFEVTKEHLKLLKKMNVDWDDCEFGAPCINPKRPYGNSDVYGDMTRILGEKFFMDAYGDEHVSAEQSLRFDKLHKGLETVLQIALSTGKFEIGLYEEEDFQEWRKIK